VNENYTPEDEMITHEIFGLYCFKCKSVDDITIDHHNSLYEGNALDVFNAIPLCRSCNSTKGIKSPKEFYDSAELLDIEGKFNVIAEILK